MDPSPELALVLACARGHLRGAAAERAERILSGPLDWDRVIGLALAHTLLPMVRRCLLDHADKVPVAAVGRIAREHVAGATLAGRLADELGRLLMAFRADDVEVLAYKGPALAFQVYGDVRARGYRDLDLIVRPDDFEQARAVLLAAGYQAAHEDVARTPPELLRRSECDESFVHAGTGVLVELHWAVTPPYFSMPLDVEGLFQRQVVLATPEQPIPAPGPEDALILLCINGTKDGWGRLETLAAIAELIRVHPSLDWGQATARVTAMHGRRLWHVGLLLASTLVEADIPEALASQAAADAVVVKLVGEVRDRLFREETDRLPLVQRASFIVRSRERGRDRMAFWLKRALTPSRRDVAVLRLPSQLWSAYYAIRPVRLLAERLRARRE